MDINVIGRSLWLMSNLTGHYRHSPANNVIGRIIVFVRNIYTSGENAHFSLGAL
jgi:hypothetical protein